MRRVPIRRELQPGELSGHSCRQPAAHTSLITDGTLPGTADAVLLVAHLLRTPYNSAVRGIRGLLIGYGLIALLAGWPIVPVVMAGLIASWNRCTLHEGFANACVVNGYDLGGALYAMSMMGWYMLGTIPLGALAFVVWTIGWILWSVLRKRSRSGAVGG